MSTSARSRKLNRGSLGSLTSLGTVLIPASIPRNALVILAKQRKAGKHEMSKSTDRRKAARAARIEADSA